METTMSLTPVIGLNPAIAEEMQVIAIREGVSPNEHAAFLFLMGRAMTREGRGTAFGHAVADVLVSRSLDTRNFAAAIDDLIAICTAPSASGGDRAIEATSNIGATLRRWRKLDVHFNRIGDFD